MARFIYPIHIRWADIDGYQHVNNSVYLEYLSQTRVAMFFHPSMQGRFGLLDGMVIARHEIDYKRQITYKPEPIEVHMWVEDMRGASFTTGAEIRDGDTVAVRAKTICVRVDKEKMEPRRLTPEDREFLSGFVDEPAG
ncbi:MAG TPA: thioesterase family protein [Jatrophihabitans sp.]|jgi:acyl-CoA thioester hydrolase